MEGKVPTGTATFTFRTGKLGRDGRLDRTNIEIREPPRNKTDIVSYDPPMVTRPQQKVYDLMMSKPKYGNNHMSQVHWMPYENMEDERNQKAKLPSRREEMAKK